MLNWFDSFNSSPGGRMSEITIVDTVAAASALIETDDPGEAQELLTRALSLCEPAADRVQAEAIVEGTGLLVELDAGLRPWAVLGAHVERMHRLTVAFDDADLVGARAEAELCRFEWVHSPDDLDPVTLVDVLDAATSFSERGFAVENERVRRAAAEAALTAQTIRDWLDQDALSIAEAMESLASRLADETDERLRHIRLTALSRSATLRIAEGADTDVAAEMLRAVIVEGAGCPPARDLRFAATLLLADISLSAGVPPEEALSEAFAVLRDDVVTGTPGILDVRLRTRQLEEILRRLPTEDRDRVAIAEWNRLVDRYTADEDPEVRAAALDAVWYRAVDASTATAADLAILQHADAAALHDTDEESASARFRVAAQIVSVLGHPDTGPLRPSAAHRDPALSVRLSEDLERRFPDVRKDPDLDVLLARLTLDRALRLSDIGRRDDALSVLSGFRAKFATAPAERVRHLFAQARYWEGRFQREAGHRGDAQRALYAVVSEFARDSDADVRVWAANGLYSAWGDRELSASESDALFHRFAELFTGDADVRIRRHEASGRLNQAVRAHENGATKQAVQDLKHLVGLFADETDADIVDTVRLAHENLAVLSLTPSPAAASTVESEARYRALRDRLTEAEQQYDTGQAELAARQWRAIADIAAGSPDPNVAVLGLAALDLLGGYLNDSRQWPALIEIAQRAMLTRGHLDFRAERMRARAYLRFGIAQSFIGDPRSALSAYESLDALVATSTDDELMTARQQAVYNRAVLIDDLGDAQAAIAAYDHVLAVHAASRDSQPRRLRRVKALRNKARLLNDLNLIVETAHANRQILDIAVGNPDPELSERARTSAFELARCYTRLGDPTSAAQTYSWIRSQPSLGFTAADIRTAAHAQKMAEREARRLAKTGRRG